MDGLRGLAAFAVLLSHIEVMRNRNIASPTLYFPGQMAVDVFFVLSGFVMAYSYLRGRVDWRRFLLARFARIYPLHIATALLILLMNLAGGYWLGLSDNRVLNVREGVEELFLLSALPGFSPFVWNMPSWSISIEWWLYLTLFPCLALLTRRTPVLLAAAAVITLYATLGLYLNAHYLIAGTTRGGVAIARGAGGFAAGWAVWRLWRDTALAPPGWLSDAAALVITLAWFASYRAGYGQGWFALALIPLLILGLARGHGVAHTLLATAPLVWLGRISYSIYLTHMLVLMPLQVVLRKAHVAQHLLVWAMIAIPVTLALSAASYRFLERPARDWLRGLPAR